MERRRLADWTVATIMAGKICAGFGCNNYQKDKNKKGLSFFRFPKDKDRYVYPPLNDLVCAEKLKSQCYQHHCAHVPRPSSVVNTILCEQLGLVFAGKSIEMLVLSNPTPSKLRINNSTNTLSMR